MAFEVLFNFLANVTKLREQLEQAKADLSAANIEQIRQVQQLDNVIQRSEDNFQAAQARHNKALEQQAIVEKSVTALAEKRQEIEAKIASQSAKFQANALRSFDSSRSSQTIQALKAIADAQENNTRVAVEGAARQLQQQNNLRTSFIQTAKLQNALAQQQIQQQAANAKLTQLRQQGLAGLGITLPQTGIPGAGALGSIITSFAFGGPVSGGLAAAALSIGGIVKSFTSLVGLVTDVTKQAFEFSQELENSKIAMAAIIAQTGTLIDAQGKVIPDTQKFSESLKIAGDLQERLLGFVLKTNITFKEAQTAVQAGLGFLVTKGVQPDDAAVAIIRLTSLAKSLGIEGARAAFQIRSVFTGTRSQLSVLLQSVGLTRQVFQTLSGPELTAAIDKGTKFLAQGIVATTSLLKVQVENVVDAIQVLLARAFGPSGDKASAFLANVLSLFTDIQGKFTGIALEIQRSFASLFSTLESGFEKVFAPENVLAFAQAAKAAAQALDGVSAAIIQLLTGQAKLSGFFNLLTNVLTKVTAVAQAVTAVSKAPDTTVSAFRKASGFGVLEEGVAKTNVVGAAGAATSIVEEGLQKGLSPAVLQPIADKLVKDFVDAQNRALASNVPGKVVLFFDPVKSLQQGIVEARKQIDVALAAAADEMNKKEEARARLASGASITVSDTELKTNLGKIDLAITELKRQQAELQHPTGLLADLDAEQKRLGLLHAATTDQIALAKVEHAIAVNDAKIQDEQIRKRLNTKVIIDGVNKATGDTADIEAGLLKLTTAREAILRRQDEIKTLNSRRDGLIAENKEIATQIDLLLKRFALSNQKLGEQGGSSDLATSLRVENEAAVSAAQRTLAIDQGLAAEAQKLADNTSSQVGHLKAVNDAEAARKKVNQDIIGLVNAQTGSVDKLGERVSGAVQDAQGFADKIQQITDSLQERNDAIQKIDPVFVAEDRFLTQLDREAVSLDKVNKALAIRLSTAQEAAQFSGQSIAKATEERAKLEDQLNTIQSRPQLQNVATQELVQGLRQQIAALTLVIEGYGRIKEKAQAVVPVLQEQQDQLAAQRPVMDAIKESGLELLNVAKEIAFIDTAITQLDAERNLLTAQVTAGVKDSASAAVDDLNIRRQIIELEAQRVADLEREQALHARNIEALRQRLVLEQGNAEATAIIQRQLAGQISAQRRVTVEILQSKAAALQLVDAFSNLLIKISEMKPRLGNVLTGISAAVNKISGALGIKIDTSGFQDILAGLQVLFPKKVPGKDTANDPVAAIKSGTQQTVDAQKETTAAVDRLTQAATGGNGQLTPVGAPGAQVPLFGGDQSDNGDDNSVGKKIGAVGSIIGGVISDLKAQTSTARKAVNSVADTVAGFAAATGTPTGLIVAAAIEIGKQIFNAIADLFSGGAKALAAKIAREVQDINVSFQTGSTNLAQTIDSLRQQLGQVDELAKKRGGKDLAKQEGDQIRQELAQLRAQQAQILLDFKNQLATLSLGAGFQSVIQTVTQALEQIHQFVGAGGSLADATKFMSLTLENLKKNLTGDIESAQIDALNRAQNLINLEQQRADLIQQNEEQIRSILSQGLATRELTASEKRAQALAAQGRTFQQQLDSIDGQIKSEKALLDVQKQLLGSNVNLNDLKSIQNQLTVIQVDQEKTKLAVLLQEQQVIAGIVKNAAGNFILSPDLFKILQQAGAFNINPGIGQQPFVAGDLNIVINGGVNTSPIVAPFPVKSPLGGQLGAEADLQAALMRLLQARGILK